MDAFEARQNAKRVTTSSLGSILAPTRGVRDAQRRSGVVPHDYHRDNLQLLRNVQRAARLTEEERQAREALDAMRPDKYAHVAPRVTCTEPPRSPSTPTHAFLHAHTREKETLHTQSRPPRASIKPPVPRANEPPPPLGLQSSVDHLRRNIHQARSQPRVSKSKPEDVVYTKKSDYGKVPEYLIQRQIELAEEEKRRRAQDHPSEESLVPLSEEERQETLAILRENEATIRKNLQRLPLVIETPSMKQRKAELDARLEEVEGALQLFSKPEVFVAADPR